MAFTLQQQHDIIYLLGWPGKTLIEASTHYNSVIWSRLQNLNAPIEAQAGKLVKRVQAIDEILQCALARLSTLELDGIKLNPEEISRLRRERKAILTELSDLLDIEVMKSNSSMISVQA
jgi:hypothetical protein